MQRRVLLGAGAAIAVIAAVAAFNLAGRHQAARVVAKDIDQITANLPAGYTATHGATEVNPITGTVTMKNLVVSLDGKPQWSADTLTVTGLDQQALHDVFDPAAYPNGHPAWTARRLLIGDATASGVHLPDDASPGGGMDVGSITLHGLRGRPFMLPPTHDRLASPALRADIALAFALQSLDVHDVSIRTNGPPQPTQLVLGIMSVRDYDGGVVGKASIGQASVHVQPEKPGANKVDVTLDQVAVKDVDAVVPLHRLQLNEAPSRANLAGLRSGALTLSGLGLDVTPGPRITLTSMSAQGSPGSDGTPGTGEATLTGLTFALKDTPLAAGPSAMIAAFGMNALTMDITAKSTTDQASRLVHVTEDIDLHQLGTLHLSLSAGLKFPADPGQDPKVALMTTPIDHAVVEWHDQGLVNRAFNAAAARMNTTPDAVRAQLAMPIITLGFLMPDQPDVADQLTAFLKNPGTLKVTMDPPQPVTLAEIGQAPAEGRAHLLGVHIESK